MKPNFSHFARIGSYLKKPILYIIIPVGAFIIFAVLANYHCMISKGTNVAFQSSDGKWADREVLMKGHTFEHIVFLFELYRIECNAQDAMLQRITPKPPRYSPRHYYNNYQDPKWLAPYATAFEPSNSGWYQSASRDQCVNKGLSKEEILSEAKKKAKTYISDLSSQSNSL